MNVNELMTSARFIQLSNNPFLEGFSVNNTRVVKTKTGFKMIWGTSEPSVHTIYQNEGFIHNITGKFITKNQGYIENIWYEVTSMIHKELSGKRITIKDWKKSLDRPILKSLTNTKRTIRSE